MSKTYAKFQTARRKLLVIAGGAVLSAIAATSALAQNIPYQTGTYTIKPGVTFDVYTPSSSPYGSKRPILLFIHGGGWSSGSRTDLASLAQYYAGYGFITVTTDYRLAPANPWPAQYEDVRDVVYSLRHNAAYLQGDPNRIASIGFSAGGHLAALLGTAESKDSTQTSSRVNRVITIAAPWDLWDPYVHKANYTDSSTYGMIYNLFGQKTPNQTQATQASPQSYIDRNAVKSLIFHGNSDTLVPYTQATNACTKLNSFGAKCQLVTMTNTGHALPSDINVILNQLNPYLNNWALGLQ